MRQNVTKSLLLSDRPTVTADQPKTQRQDCVRAIGLQLLFPLVSITEYDVESNATKISSAGTVYINYVINNVLANVINNYRHEHIASSL